MFEIFYKTHGGVGVTVQVASRAEVVERIKGLWQARIKASAYDVETGETIGAVWSEDGTLTYWTEEAKCTAQ